MAITTAGKHVNIAKRSGLPENLEILKFVWLYSTMNLQSFKFSIAEE